MGDEPAAGCCTRLHGTLFYEPELATKKSELRARWPMMLLLCLGLSASYYAFDVPAATETALSSAFLGSGATSDTCINGTNIPAADNAAADSFAQNFNLLYSLYSWPNVILPFFGGWLADRFGVRLLAVIFAALLVAGASLTAFGTMLIATTPSAAWYTMFAGRVLFGLGGESLCVVQSALIASYFSGRELAFALGVNVALARMGSVLNNELSAVIASNAPLSLAYWVAAAFMGVGLVAMVVAFEMDRAAEARIRRGAGLPPRATPGLLAALVGLFCGCCWARAGKAAAAAAAAASARLAPDEDKEALLLSGAEAEGVALAAAGAGEAAAPSEEIDFSAVLRFPLVYWVLTLSCALVYVDVLAFNSNSSIFITQKFLASRPLWMVCDDVTSTYYTTANSIQSITYACGAFFTPLVGSLTDTFGARAALNLLAAVAITGVHSMLAFTNWYPAGPLVLLGMSYSLYAAALWPCIAIVTQPRDHATAYGVVTALQNLGQAVAPLGIAALMPDARCATFAECVGSWNAVERLFVIVGIVGIACGIALNVVDACISPAPLLNESHAAMKAREAREAAARAAADAEPLLMLDAKAAAA